MTSVIGEIGRAENREQGPPGCIEKAGVSLDPRHFARRLDITCQRYHCSRRTRKKSHSRR